MYRNAKRISVHAALLCCLCGSMAFAQITAGQKAEVKGLIVDRDGDSLAIKTTDGNKVVVQINDNTKVQQPKGVFRHKTMAETSLIPGLAVSVKGVGTDNGQIAADSVRFSADDLKTAQQIEAGLHPTNQRVATNEAGVASNKATGEEHGKSISANKENIETNAADVEEANKRFSQLTDWDTKGVAIMTFATGSSTITAEGKAALQQLAATAKPMKGYLIQVKGFASTSGDAKRNQELSDERANAVVAALQQDGVPLHNIVAPAAMGTTDPLASNETSEGRDLNQRVQVKLLVNRGINAAK
jgi:outer membrane protein OmpA-like peptidoglycan-associated protein